MPSAVAASCGYLSSSSLPIPPCGGLALSLARAFSSVSRALAGLFASGRQWRVSFERPR